LDAGVSGVDILNVLGVPTSADHKAVAAVALKRLKESFEQLTLLPQLPFGDAMTLLRKCISTRADYLFGQLPEEAARIVAAVWDPAVERCLVAMFKGSYGARVHLMGPGGLGVARRGVTRHLDRVSGFARASEATDKYLPRQRDRAQVTAASRNPVHQEVSTVYAALPPEARATKGVYNPLSPLPSRAPPAQPSSRNRSPSSATPPSTMKATVDNLRAAVQKVQQAELFDELTPFGRLALERAAQPGARCWADAPPRFSYRQMESEEWRVAFCLWLGMAVPQLAGRPDPSGRDLLRAAPPAIRHSALLSSYLELGLQAGGTVYSEVEGLFGAFSAAVPQAARRAADGTKRRMDWVLVAGLQGCLADPTLQDGALQADVNAREINAQAVSSVEAAEADKTAYYGPDVPLGFTFYPVAHDTFTGSGKCAIAFQQWLARRLAYVDNGRQTPPASLVSYKLRDIKQRVGIAIMRACAQAVIKGFEGSPHAALTAVNRYQGLQGRRGPPVGQGGPLPQGVRWGARWGARA
jgi:hypothetical protein